jgi:N-acetylmuramoyl-L-alanine amidase
VPISTQSTRLRLRLLRAAVQDNEDIIAGRLPGPLRPGRRFLHRWARSAWVLAFPIAALVVSASLADRSVADQAAARTKVLERPDGPSAHIAESPREPQPEPSMLPRPLGADVLALSVQRVVIDAGHGGVDVGASSASGLLEKHLALDLALRVRELLIGRGVEVLLTRTADATLSLRERAATANATRGDIFVSIHLNALAPSDARGVETYYLGPGDGPEHDVVAAAENTHSGYSLADMRALLDNIYADARRDESRHLAHAVQGALVRRLRAIDPGLADRGVKTAPFIVLVATEMPAILTEVSCLSNAEEAERLATPAYRQTVAEALASGIQAFIDQKNTHRGERKDPSES